MYISSFQLLHHPLETKLPKGQSLKISKRILIFRMQSMLLYQSITVSIEIKKFELIERQFTPTRLSSATFDVLDNDNII